MTIKRAMQLFYSTKVNGNIIELEEEETRHLRVLRKNLGDQLEIVDGKGKRYTATLTALHKKASLLSIQSTITSEAPRVQLHIAIAPTKNISRFEWFLEKATEIGITEIFPILCEHSERSRIRLDRLNKIVVSAMKQSNRLFLPHLHELVSFETFLKDYSNKGQKFIAHCEDQPKKQLATNYRAQQDVLVLIGPEGDFSVTEIEQALAGGFVPVSLGNHRLRTETAGVVACHTIQLLNEMNS